MTMIFLLLKGGGGGVEEPSYFYYYLEEYCLFSNWYKSLLIMWINTKDANVHINYFEPVAGEVVWPGGTTAYVTL